MKLESLDASSIQVLRAPKAPFFVWLWSQKHILPPQPENKNIFLSVRINNGTRKRYKNMDVIRFCFIILGGLREGALGFLQL